MTRIDWQCVRREFPSLEGRTFLNTATYGQLPRRAAEAAAGHFRRREETACADFLSWFDDAERLRESIARLIHASAEDIAFFPNACSALGMVLNGIDWQPGDEILTLEHDFPNQIYAAESLKDVRGVECEWNEIEQHVSARTRLVLVSTVDYVTGERPNLAPTLARLRDRGILVLLDGTQSIGALEFDCRTLRPDFLVVDAYKWMISPNGAGFLYVEAGARKWLRPNVIGWRSDRDWRNVDALHHGAPRFSERAERYEGGMLPFPSLYAMQASLELIEQLGIDAIQNRVLGLASLTKEELRRLGAQLDAPAGDYLDSQIVAARFPGADVSALAKQLGGKNIVVSARRGYLRVSPHFYNNDEDVGTLSKALRTIL